MAIGKLLRGASSIFSKQETLYYPGCMTEQRHQIIYKKYKSMLSDAGIDFVTFEDMPCCGSALASAGCTNEFNIQRKKLEEFLQKNNIRKIITNCPHCLSTLSSRYGMECEHISQTLNKSNFRPSRTQMDVAYHDPCILAAKGIIDEPRQLLRKKGCSIKEPSLCKDSTYCCGAGAGLAQNNPGLSAKIAKKRLDQIKASTIVVGCPYCYSQLKRAGGKNILELSEALYDDE